MQGRIIKNRRFPLPVAFLRWWYRLAKQALFPHKPTLKQIERGGLKFLVWSNEDIGKQLLLRGSYEKETILAFRNFIQKGDVCIDVGGNIGYYALNFARMSGIDGQIFVFEPIRRNALVIELSAYLNNISNIQIFNEVVSEKSGRADFIIPSDSAYAYLSSAETSPLQGEHIQCRSTTLDDFVVRAGIQGRIGVVKIDVEGAEGLVLRGMQKILSDDELRPRVILLELVDEYLGAFGFSSDKIIGGLSRFGYSPFWADDQGKLHCVLPEHKEQGFNFFFVHSEFIRFNDIPLISGL
jgi:FkbM family methyltransferase